MTKRVLLMTFSMLPAGGGSAVGAWALEALKGSGYRVHVVSWRNSDIAQANRIYGTTLDEARFTWQEVSPAVRSLLKFLPFRLSLLEMMLVNRLARRHLARHEVDVVLSTMNEIDVGRRAIQYVHFPWAFFPRPGRDPSDHRWYHFPVLLKIYRGLVSRLAGFTQARSARNLALVNSRWTGIRYQQCYGVEPQVLYPPVIGGFPANDWHARDLSFGCLGRISNDKEIPKIIDILTEVRAAGFPVRLRVIGAQDDPALLAHLRAMPEARDWVSYHVDLPREQLVEIVSSCRYGIHGKTSEHFGIAPAELQLAGCITFVPDDGGSVEVVGNDARLIYTSAGDAARKIIAVLQDENMANEIRARMPTWNAQFSKEHFEQAIRDLVDTFPA